MANHETDRRSENRDADKSRDKTSGVENDQKGMSEVNTDANKQPGKTDKDPAATDHHPDHRHEEESFQKRELNEDETY